MTIQNDNNLERRKFLVRAGKAGISIAAAGLITSQMYDRQGPKGGVDADSLVTLPDFSAPTADGQTLSIVRGPDRKATVNKAIELLGGIGRFVEQGQTVVIKPNVAFATAPMLCATSHPELVAEVVRLCYKAGAKKVIVTDNPINDPASCFLLSGIGKAATQAGAEVILPKDTLFRHTTLTGAMLIQDWPMFFGPLIKADKLIGISPVKDHARAGASMSMKNWYGLLGGRRNIFHQNINGIIAELAMLIKPTLVILDGTEVMLTNGPTGGSTSDLNQANTMIASTNCVAADSFGCNLLGLSPADLPYLAKAENAGAGTTDYESLKPKITSIE
ncbi:DUF362 domain-containing protein [Planctomycetota bacterium]